MRKFILLIFTFILLLNCSISVYAANDTKLLQSYFVNDGKTLSIFFEGNISKNAQVTIGNDTFAPEINTDTKINTIFLIDNSRSIPEAMRNLIKNAILDYISTMPENESVKIAKFDKDVTGLSEYYSRDKQYISYALSQIDFSGRGSYIYDAILKAIEQNYTDEDVYYRIVLVTDGSSMTSDYSFTYLKTELEENNRYHIDVVHVCEKPTENDVLKGIANCSSNTYMPFYYGSDLTSLYPKDITVLKIPMNNSLTIGGYMGVTVQDGEKKISVGSILFPQVNIEDTNNITILGLDLTTFILIAVGAVLLIGGVTVSAIILTKKLRKCVISVDIKKDNHNDTDCVGTAKWSFKRDKGFRVGRILKPMGDNSRPLPENQFAICERANEEAMLSIGRNAFIIFYESVTKRVKIQNIAQNAMITVIVGDRIKDLKKGEACNLEEGSQILIGTYTTIHILKIRI
ncbi:MAG: vWA domain-containing protein [Acutalibacteraceae bacterium]